VLSSFSLLAPNFICSGNKFNLKVSSEELEGMIKAASELYSADICLVSSSLDLETITGLGDSYLLSSAG